MEKIAEGIFFCGTCDRQRKIFDQLVPLPQGTTYNSYLVVGADKTALIDTTYAKFEDGYLEAIAASGAKIDYIISNHAEPDHSAAIPALLKIHPNAEVYCTAKCAENLQNMLGVPADRIRAVSDGQKLPLGGKTLRFMPAPWVHWPDTMLTYLEEDSMLFTCDFFGAHYTSNGLFADLSPELAEAAKRYYAEIMMPFANFCAKYLAKVKELSPKAILPSHGPVYAGKDAVEFIENLYEKWTDGSSACKAVIAYVSMYDSTKLMADYLENALASRGVQAVKADLMESDEGELAEQLVDAAGIVFGTPMVLNGPHPKSVYLAYIANILRPKLKFTAVFGSLGWAGKLDAPIDAMFTQIKPQKLETVAVKGRPTPEDFKRLDALADAIAAITKPQ